MFWANTKPVPDAATDFGEISPVTVRTKWSRTVDDGIVVVVVVVGAVVELVALTAVVLVVVGATAAASWGGESSRTRATANPAPAKMITAAPAMQILRRMRRRARRFALVIYRRPAFRGARRTRPATARSTPQKSPS